VQVVDEHRDDRDRAQTVQAVNATRRLGLPLRLLDAGTRQTSSVLAIGAREAAGVLSVIDGKRLLRGIGSKGGSASAAG
jgi:hypothetical protein